MILIIIVILFNEQLIQFKYYYNTSAINASPYKPNIIRKSYIF